MPDHKMTLSFPIEGPDGQPITALHFRFPDLKGARRMQALAVTAHRDGFGAVLGIAEVLTGVPSATLENLDASDFETLCGFVDQACVEVAQGIAKFNAASAPVPPGPIH